MICAVRAGRATVTAQAIGAATAAEVLELEFVTPEGRRVEGPLLSTWHVRFEDCSPVRSVRTFKGQRNFDGLWWLATTGRHVGFESWLEREHLMLLDLDPDVVGVSSQPFWLRWRSDGRARQHAPDFFARCTDGSGLVVDVRPDERISDRDAEAFSITARGLRAGGPCAAASPTRVPALQRLSGMVGFSSRTAIVGAPALWRRPWAPLEIDRRYRLSSWAGPE
jgi:hypothetical protein